MNEAVGWGYYSDEYKNIFLLMLVGTENYFSMTQKVEKNIVINERFKTSSLKSNDK